MNHIENLIQQRAELVNERKKYIMCPPPSLMGKINRITRQIEASRIAERARAMEVKRTQRFNHEA